MKTIIPYEREGGSLLIILILAVVTSFTVFSGLAVVSFSPTYEYQKVDIEESDVDVNSIENIENMDSEQREVLDRIMNNESVTLTENKFNVSQGTFILIGDGLNEDYIGIDVDEEENIWSLALFFSFLTNIAAIGLAYSENDRLESYTLLSFIACIGIVSYVAWVVVL